MRYFASLLAIASLSAATLSASASVLDPISQGFALTVDNTVLTSNTAGVSLDPQTGMLTYKNATSTYTFVGADASPLVSALSITRVCLTLPLTSCDSSVVSISNANVLNGTLQLSAFVGASLKADAQANVSDLVFANASLGVGTESALVGYPANGGSSPVPEPGTLGLLGTGVLGAAGAIRRRFVA